MTPSELISWYVILTIICALYFVPSIVAGARKHHQGSAIFLLNLFLGFTGLGWVAALVWSVTAIPAKETPAIVTPEPEQLAMSL